MCTAERRQEFSRGQAKRSPGIGSNEILAPRLGCEEIVRHRARGFRSLRSLNPRLISRYRSAVPRSGEMTWMKRRDIAAGLLLAGVGIYVTRQARTMSYRDEFGPGAGFLPLWLGLLLSVLALCLVAFALRSSPEAPQTEPGGGPGKPRWRSGLAMLAWLALVAMVATLEALGFIASFALLSFFLVYVVERRSLLSAMTVAVAIALSFLLLFRVILPVPLPANLWGF